ncbi:MAG: hypothetical protein ACYDAD_13770 [Acidimicrobiales bacterium]
METIKASTQGLRPASRAVVNIRHWPGLKRWRRPHPPGPAERLRDRIACVMVALPERDAVPERLGLGAY